MLRLFVYGSLKQGGEHHDAYCSGLSSAEAAAVRGALYEAPEGHPVLVVSREDVLARASGDAQEDLVLQERWAARLTQWESRGAAQGPRLAPLVRGELFRFQDAAALLAAVDELEGFRPGRPSGPGSYTRVLVPVRRASGILTAAWTYTAPVPWRAGPGLRHLPSGVWS